MKKDVRCKCCGKEPDQITEYIDAAAEEGMTPLEYVQSEEGTYNDSTGKFFCTSCYIKIGMPLGKA